MDPLIITVAPNGARRGKADHPAIPLTPAEIGIEAARCQEAGAAMIHLHVRDAEGRHSLDPDLYRAAIAAVRKEAGSDLIVQVTTEAVGIFTPDQQIAAMQALQPEAFSVAVRELIPDAASETAAARFLKQQAERGCSSSTFSMTRTTCGGSLTFWIARLFPAPGPAGCSSSGAIRRASSHRRVISCLSWTPGLSTCLGPCVRSAAVKRLARSQRPAWAAMFGLGLKTTSTCRTGPWRLTMLLWSVVLRMRPNH